jgi:cobalt/nickel transport system ATP-binding protein
VKHHFIDRYAVLDSPLHTLEARSKILAFTALIVCVPSVPAGSGTLLLPHFFVAAILMGISQVPLTYIMGSLVETSNLKQIRRQVGLLFQDPNDQLFCPTVFEDVAFGPLNLSVPADEIPGIVEKALKDSGLSHSIRLRSSHHLSLGERGRVSLATVLAMKPAILTMGEPTSNLDPRNRHHLTEVILGFKATLIIATHDLEFVLDVCSRTVLMDQGRIGADGETRSILGNNQLMELRGLEVPLSLRLEKNTP